MKKNLMSFGVMMAAIFTLSSCVKEFSDNMQNDSAAGVPFEFSASIDTKTVNAGMATNWSAGDAVNLFHAKAGSTNFVSDGSFSIAEADLEINKFRGTLKEALTAGQSYDWYAFYPYIEALSTPANTSAAILIGSAAESAQVQTADASLSHIAGETYPVYGSAKSVSASVLPVLEMKHLSALVEVVVKNTLASPITVSSVALTAQEDIVGTFYVDFSSESPVCTSAQASKTASLNVTEPVAVAKNAEAKLYLAIKPFTAAAGQKLALKVNDYVKEITLADAVSFNAGKIRTLNFDFNALTIPVVTASKVAFSSATLTWTVDGTAESYNVYVNGTKVATVEGDKGTYDVTGLASGVESTIEVEAVAGTKTAKSETVKVKTAGVYEVENNTGTSFLCIGWDELARTEVNGSRQAYQIQVYEDQEMSSLVYDITPFTGNNNGDNYPFGNGSYLGKSSQPQTASGLKCENILTPTRISVGGFYPNTTYYVRVRTRASYVNTPDSDAKTITHPYGDSPWSDLVPMTTDAEHVPAANEVIYGGFNDFCVQTDFLSPAIGARLSDYKKALSWDTVKANGTLNFRFYAFGHGLHQGDSYNLAKAGITRIDGTKNPLHSTGSTIHIGNAKGTGNTYIGDMENWIWAGWTRPCMGAIALDGKGTFVATPPLSDDKLSVEGTNCNVSFTAAFRIRIGDNPDVTVDGLQIQAWRASDQKYEIIKTYKLGDLLPYDPATSTTTDVVNDYDRNKISCDLILHPGDNVELVSQKSGYLIIDDILVVTK